MHGCERALPVFMIFGVLKYVEVYRNENSKFPQDEEGGRGASTSKCCILSQSVSIEGVGCH